MLNNCIFFCVFSGIWRAYIYSTTRHAARRRPSRRRSWRRRTTLITSVNIKASKRSGPWCSEQWPIRRRVGACSTSWSCWRLWPCWRLHWKGQSSEIWTHWALSRQQHTWLVAWDEPRLFASMKENPNVTIFLWISILVILTLVVCFV